MKDTNEKQNRIRIDYLDGLIDTNTLNECKSEIEKAGFELLLHPYTKQYLNGVEEIFSAITIFISSDIFKNVIDGIAAIEVLVCIPIKIYNAIKNKKVKIIRPKKVIEETPSVSIKAKNINILIPTELDEDKFKYCIDKAFESIRDNQALIDNSETITFYDKHKDLFITKEKLLYFRDKYINKDE